MNEDWRKWAQGFVLVSTAFVSAFAMVAPPTWKPYMDAYITGIMSAAAALHILPAKGNGS